MPNLIEIVWSLYGCCRIALRDNNALGYFNLSASGFWASFGAMLLIVPVLFVEGYLDYKAMVPKIEFSSFIFIKFIIVSLAWFGYLALVGLLDSYVFKTGKFGIFTIVFNWAYLAINLFWIPFYILILGLMGPEATALFSLMYIGLSYVFLWFVITETLKISGGIAGLLAFGKFILVILIQVAVFEIYFN